jgi:hypothetical protein
MFDKTYHNSNIDFPSEINVHHHRPTTTKQIQQLREIEKEMKDSVLGMVKVENNELKFNFFIRQKYECFSQHELIVKYKLNGEERTVTHICEIPHTNPKEAMQKLFKKLSEDIVEWCVYKNSDDIIQAVQKAFGKIQ